VIGAGTTVRWWVAPPGPDESLGSLVARAAAFFEGESGWLWTNLLEGRTDIDMDDPPAAVLVRLARATGIAARQLQGHRLADAPGLLARGARSAYCPVCWAEQGGEVPSQRRSWMGCFRTVCEVHRAPLLAWRPHQRAIPLQLPAFDPTDRDILDLIDKFGRTLEGSLLCGEPWPEAWKGDAMAARTMLLRVCFNYDAEAHFAPVSDVVATRTLRPYIHGPIRIIASKKRVHWDDFRRIADPVVRRAALWLVAWRVMPGLEDRFRPGWFRD
jgi:hypothetical protein